MDPARPDRKKRASRTALRTTAWAAAGASLAVPALTLAAAPVPPAGPGVAAGHTVIVVHRTVRRVVIDQATGGPSAVASKPQVRYVYVGGGAASAGGSATTTRCSRC